MMTEITDRVKDQLEQFNSTLDQVINASRGLYILIKEESNKQFGELVVAGEAQKAAEADGASSLLTQLSKDVTGQFDDVKGSLTSIRNASLGLLVKAKESSEQTFSELAEKGQPEKAAEEEATEAAE